jgi:hypothetical protein
MWCYVESLQKHIGTCWKHVGNLVGTYWELINNYMEHIGNIIGNPMPHMDPFPCKGNKIKLLQCTLPHPLLIVAWNFYPNYVPQHFKPRLMAWAWIMWT